MLCEGVVGQELARRYFTNAIAGGRVSHAYLLAGPAGVGKRRFADELAAALLCRAGPLRACGSCVSCRTLVSGNHPAYSVVAPEPGKRLEIDSVRAAIESLSLRGEPRRIMVLDEADRMNDPAANAFLKTLEEPPPGIIFLLVTARPAHLLPTIISRSHRVPFVPLSNVEFDTVLTRLEIDPHALPGLHRGSSGSPGRALQILAGIEACGGNERFQSLLDGLGSDRPEALFDYLPAASNETKRDHARRVLQLVLEGLWWRRTDDPDALERLAARVVRLDEFLRDVDGNLNPDLIIEETAQLLSRDEAGPSWVRRR
ncbi:MAG: ATP-binding protein [Planctomycetota bacterium]